MAMPGGSAPAHRLSVYGPVPPLLVIAWVTSVPWLALVSGELVVICTALAHSVVSPTAQVVIVPVPTVKLSVNVSVAGEAGTACSIRWKALAWLAALPSFVHPLGVPQL